MKQIIRITSLLISIFYFSLPGHAKTAVLQGVHSYHKGSKFITELEFDQEIQSKDIQVEFIRQTIQLNIPEAAIAKSIFKRVKEKDVKSIYAYQFNKNLLRTRIIYNKIEASQFKGSVDLASVGNKVYISIPKPSLVTASHLKEDLSSKDNTAVATAAGVDSAKSDIDLDAEIERASHELSRNEKVGIVDKRKNLTLTGQNKAQIEKNLPESQIPVFTKEKKKEVTAKGSPWTRLIFSFLIILASCGGLIAFAKWWKRTRPVNTEKTKIRVLTQFHLGPKKSLAIVRVAGEAILIGVTDHNISMIKTLTLMDDELLDSYPNQFSDAISEVDLESVTDKFKDKVTHSTTDNSYKEVSNTYKEKPNSYRSKPVMSYKDDFLGNISDQVTDRLKKMRTL